MTIINHDDERFQKPFVPAIDLEPLPELARTKPERTPEMKVVDAIRGAVIDLQVLIDEGKRSTHFDAEDVMEILLNIAEELEAS